MSENDDSERFTNYPSLFKIGEKVHLCLTGKDAESEKTVNMIECYIRAIIFTSSKIRYSVYVIKDKTTLHNIDSVFIYKINGCNEVIELDEDNYS